MKLPKLSLDEIRALHVPNSDDRRELAMRFKAHLAASLAAHVRVDVHALSSPVRIQQGDSPRMNADDELLAAWVAARFGSMDAHQPVSERYRPSLLKKVEQALAELVLRGKIDGRSSLCLEIQLNSHRGKLEIDWSDLTAAEFKEWAVKQWAAG